MDLAEGLPEPLQEMISSGLTQNVSDNEIAALARMPARPGRRHTIQSYYLALMSMRAEEEIPH